MCQFAVKIEQNIFVYTAIYIYIYIGYLPPGPEVPSVALLETEAGKRRVLCCLKLNVRNMTESDVNEKGAHGLK